MKLHGISYHSVKGGVGRTYLATAAALLAAREDPKRPVYLIDADLTGTSMADGMAICAPQWSTVPKLLPATLMSKAPDGFHSRQETRRLVEERHKRQGKNKSDFMVPFLNDFILFATPDWDNEKDVRIESICWRRTEGPDNLHVIPSSALPQDLHRLMPVINDEEHAAFIEARLEWLLAGILKRHPKQEVWAIFDTPRGIYSVSRSVLSIGLRLSATPKQSLAEDGGMPFPLDTAEITWKARFVVSKDLQDKVAMGRWLKLAKEGEQKQIEVVSV